MGNGFFFSGLARGVAGGISKVIEQKLEDERRQKSALQQLMLTAASSGHPEVFDNPEFSKMGEKLFGKETFPVVQALAEHINPMARREREQAAFYMDHPDQLPEGWSVDSKGEIKMTNPKMRPLQPKVPGHLATTSGLYLYDENGNIKPAVDPVTGQHLMPELKKGEGGTAKITKAEQVQRVLDEYNARRLSPDGKGKFPDLAGISTKELQIFAGLKKDRQLTFLDQLMAKVGAGQGLGEPDDSGDTGGGSAIGSLGPVSNPADEVIPPGSGSGTVMRTPGSPGKWQPPQNAQQLTVIQDGKEMNTYLVPTGQGTVHVDENGQPVTVDANGRIVPRQ